MVKYLTLTFSNKQQIPKENETQTEGYGIHGGFRHNQFGFLRRLPYIALYLKRKAVFPPPWLSLEKKHNNYNIFYDRKWSDFFDMTKIDNIELNYPFKFNKNGIIESDTCTIKYYDSNHPYEEMDTTVDIIVLSNYNKNEHIRAWTHLKMPRKINFSINVQFDVSNKIKKIVKTFEINKPFDFIHIRRGDTCHWKMENFAKFTSPKFIAFILKNICCDVIIVATDEKNIEYKKKISHLLPNKKVIFEEFFIKKMPSDIQNDNYMIYQIMHEIANHCRINIGTVGYCRLGKQNNYNLNTIYNAHFK